MILQETAKGSHITLGNLTSQPAAGSSVIQLETGVTIRRITDVALIKTSLSASFQNWDGHTTTGLTNGYSRFPCVSLDGKYAIAFGTTPLGVLIDLSNVKPLGLIQSAKDSTGKLGDLQETKWSGDVNVPHLIGYCEGHTYWRQDPTLAPSFSKALPNELTYGDFGAPIMGTSDGDWDNSGQRIAEKVALSTDGKVYGVRALNNGKLMPWTILGAGVPNQYPAMSVNGVDISPSGQFVKVDNYFFDFETGAYLRHNAPGHGGWAIGKAGSEWFVNQNTETDWIEAFSPATGETLQLMRMGSWSGIHVASDKRGVMPGWALISVYKTTEADPLANDVFALELKSQKPGMVHPNYYKATLAETAAAYLKRWNNTNEPVQVIRICSLQHLYKANQYFTEGWAEICADGHIYWGGNWNGTDNLELYRAELPTELRAYLGIKPLGGTPVILPTPTKIELFAGASLPEYGIDSYPIGPDGVQQNYIYCSNSGQGVNTRANYCPITKLRTDAYTFNGKIYTRQTFIDAGAFDAAQILYWNLSKLPKGLIIKRAYLLLWGTDPRTEGGNLPTGKEQIPIKIITNPLNWPTIWTAAPPTVGTAESTHLGASWVYWNNDGSTNVIPPITFGKTKWGFPKGCAPYSGIDVNAPTIARWGTGIGRYGNLSTVLQTIPNNPLISFNPDKKTGSQSDDITSTVQSWISGATPNFGLCLDTNNALASEPIPVAPNINPSSLVHVGIMTNYQDISTRPRLVIEC